MKANLEVLDVPVAGQRQHITLRSYRPTFEKRTLPIVIYLHGGGFTEGRLDDADYPASELAQQLPAWVVSVDYSLAPRYPFPTAPEDGYIALAWAVNNARNYRADSLRIAAAGHDAGGNIAASLSAMARDRGEFKLAAQALMAPLLDPGLTRVVDQEEFTNDDLGIAEYARCYRAYLPNAAQRIHPYAAPIESRRLVGLPPTFIASAQLDAVRREGETYAAKLIAAGVHVEAIRYSNVGHRELVSHPPALDGVISFLRRRLFV